MLIENGVDRLREHIIEGNADAQLLCRSGHVGLDFNWTAKYQTNCAEQEEYQSSFRHDSAFLCIDVNGCKIKLKFNLIYKTLRKSSFTFTLFREVFILF